MTAIDPTLVSDCVHCGFCLPSCPTYVLWREEMDSPRGRISLLAQQIQGAPLTPTVAGHLDACLGCLACVSACPSGVRYDTLITAARDEVEQRHPRTARERRLRRFIFGLFPYPRRLSMVRFGLWFYQHLGLAHRLPLPGALKTLDELAPRIRRRPRRRRRIEPAGRPRGTVALLTGCVQDAFFADVNAATARVLAAEGFTVLIPRGQPCCGALSGHTGRRAEAMAMARNLIAAFDGIDAEAIIVNAAGCGSHLKEYAELLREDPLWADRAAALAVKVADLTEFLAGRGGSAHRQPVSPLRVGYHDACHLAHGQRIRRQPRDLLRAIPGVELVELAEADLCCGSAGVYNLLQPEPARELGDRKARNVATADVDVVVTGNPGCQLQIAAALRRAGADVPVMAIASLLDRSVRPPNDQR
jgi:glycolate oxidase iron-sulfur subunit